MIERTEKHILVIDQTFPFPLHEGGKMDIYHRLKALYQLGYQISLIAFYNPNEGLPDKAPIELFCKNIFSLPYLRRKLSKIFHWKPYPIGSRENYSELLSIKECLIQKKLSFDAVFAETHNTATVARYFKKELDIPKLYLRSHDNTPKFMLSLAQTSPFLSIQQLFFLTEAVKYKFYEKVLMNTFDARDEILHISYDEQLYYKKKYPNICQKFLPAGIELSLKKPAASSKKKNVLFVGALFSPNNLHGLKWYLKKIHQKLVNKIPEYRLIIAGTTLGADLKRLQTLLGQDPNIIFYDTPKELLPIYRESQVFINPMRHGTGVKLKTLDAIINGLPVVATTIGNEGTGLINREHILVADRPKEYENALIELLENSCMREAIAAKGQDFLKKNYNQEKALQDIFAS